MGICFKYYSHTKTVKLTHPISLSFARRQSHVSKLFSKTKHDIHTKNTNTMILDCYLLNANRVEGKDWLETLFTVHTNISSKVIEHVST